MTDFNWKPYIALQREWVEKKGLKVGDRVRILRKAIDFENDWMGVWCTKMDGYVGKVVNVLAIYSGDIIIGADGYRSLCPYFVLEKVTEAESPMYIPSTDQETLAGVRKERKEVGITLKELAQELRKIFRFKYLTVSPVIMYSCSSWVRMGSLQRPVRARADMETSWSITRPTLERFLKS